MISFSENLKRLRRWHGVSQQSLGDAVGVSAVAVGKWEKGASSPEMNKLVLLADYFGVSIDALVRGGPEELLVPPQSVSAASPSPAHDASGAAAAGGRTRGDEAANRPSRYRFPQPTYERMGGRRADLGGGAYAGGRAAVMARSDKPLSPEQERALAALGRRLLAGAKDEEE